ncbi:MAG: hypothetical protein EWM47_08285 [Anaerolineaceae bacterium]|nr:MAG: hypothetical protein EWM47_08285 [Anaerolineaceae bacterium]
MPDSPDNKNPRMRNIDPRKLAILIELMKEAEGKPMDKLLPLIMNTNKKLQDQNLNFSKDESELMMEILTKNMSPKDKAQFEMLRKMMSNRK